MKSGSRRTSWTMLSAFPRCESAGAPVWCRHAKSLRITTLSSPFGSPLCSGSVPASATRVWSAPAARDSSSRYSISPRAKCPINGTGAKWRERHEVGAEVTHPVDKAVTAVENVAAGAVADVFVERRGVGLVVEAARRGLAMVPVDEAVAPSARGVILGRAANHPVVAEIAE